MSHRLLTAEELAERWQVRAGHVYRLARDGRVPAVRLGRYVRFREDAIDAWERTASVGPPTDGKCPRDAVTSGGAAQRRRDSMSATNASRRSYGTGSIFERAGAYYGRWYDASGRRVKRRLGAIRTAGASDGLTRTQAEREMRRRMGG